MEAITKTDYERAYRVCILIGAVILTFSAGFWTTLGVLMCLAAEEFRTKAV